MPLKSIWLSSFRSVTHDDLLRRLYTAEYTQGSHSTAIMMRLLDHDILLSLCFHLSIHCTISTGYVLLLTNNHKSVPCSKSSSIEAISRDIVLFFMFHASAFSIMSIWIYSLIFCLINNVGLIGDHRGHCRIFS